jgi:hypothetical protein
MIRRGVVVLVFVAPLLHGWLARPAGLRVEDAAAWLAGVVGLVALHRVLRRAEGAVEADWTVTTLLYGTFLFSSLSGGEGAVGQSAAFALAAMALHVWHEGGGPVLARRALAGAGLLLGMVLPYLDARALPTPDLLRLPETLFSSRQGLLFWNPVLWGAVAGHGLLLRRRAREAAVPLLAAALVLLVATSAAPARPYFAGGRFHAALPALALGLGAFLGWARAAVQRAPGIPLAAIGAALVVWNMGLMEQYRSGRIPRDFPVSFGDVTETNAALLFRDVGSPPAWPANWIFAWRHHVPAMKYDAVVGVDVGGRALAGRVAVGDPRVDPGLFAEGWGPRRPCGSRECREVLGRARLLIPLESRRRAALRLRASGAGSLLVLVDGETRAKLPLGEASSSFPTPSRTWERGVTEVVLVAPPGTARVESLALVSKAPSSP